VVFAGNRAGGSRLIATNADGSGSEEELLKGQTGDHWHVNAVSRDGADILFESTGRSSERTDSDLERHLLQPNRHRSVFRRTQFRELSGKLSPDGRWVAYTSDESGRLEVYVAATREGSGQWRVSTDGGTEPLWARSGRELFYRAGDRMMVVDVTTTSTFAARQPHLLFSGRFDTLDWNANYDVSADGERFLMIQPLAAAGQTPMNIVVNWFADLKHLVPLAR
jgi:Tol biopolymer transport system component